MAKKRKSLENKEMASVEIDLEKNALLNATENKDKIFEKIMCATTSNQLNISNENYSI